MARRRTMHRRKSRVSRRTRRHRRRSMRGGDPCSDACLKEHPPVMRNGYPHYTDWYYKCVYENCDS